MEGNPDSVDVIDVRRLLSALRVVVPSTRVVLFCRKSRHSTTSTTPSRSVYCSVTLTGTSGVSKRILVRLSRLGSAISYPNPTKSSIY